MNYHAHQELPEDKPIDPKTNYILCQECRALYPPAYFGKSKLFKSGKSRSCNQCKAQYLRLNRTRKYNTVSKVDDSLIRNVRHHNMIILGLAISNGLNCMAFNTSTKDDYKVVFSKDPKTNLDSMTIIKIDGSVLHEYLYSGVEDVKSIIIAFLKELNLRLELSEVHAMTSKNVIYWV